MMHQVMQMRLRMLHAADVRHDPRRMPPSSSGSEYSLMARKAGLTAMIFPSRSVIAMVRAAAGEDLEPALTGRNVVHLTIEHRDRERRLGNEHAQVPVGVPEALVGLLQLLRSLCNAPFQVRIGLAQCGRGNEYARLAGLGVSVSPWTRASRRDRLQGSSSSALPSRLYTTPSFMTKLTRFIRLMS